ncbi:MAG TPA: CDP-archaeol synthase [Pirellulaceae bacterium]|nr:CDP-archaeol synthase [Pirellulaceae bacterium]
MLIKRLASAAVIVSCVLLLVGLDHYLGRAGVLNRPGLILALVSVIVVTVAAGELAVIWRRANIAVDVGWVIFVTGLAGTAACLPLWAPDLTRHLAGGCFESWVFGLTISTAIFFALEMIRLESVPNQSNRLGRHLMIVVYLTMPLAFLVALRTSHSDNNYGMAAFLAVVVTVKLSDVGAYFVGKTWGRRPLAPRLSPKKTIEGAIGGMAGGVLGAAIMWIAVAPLCFALASPPLWFALCYGVLVSAAGMFGDLAESFIKRDAHTKDSSNWLPGLGGVLDIIDSLIFALPIAHLLLTKGQALS